MGIIVQSRVIFSFVATLLLGAPALAQEGHPYGGTWRGTLSNGTDTLPVVIIMSYDGDNIQGMINPGRNSYQFSSAELDAPNWKLDVSAQTRDGQAVAISAVLKEIGSVNRFMEGTWIQAGQHYDFKVTRE